MVQTQRERELKFEIPTGFTLPDVAAMVGRAGRVDHDDVGLTSTYYDTPDRGLLRQRVTLRRREGDADTGWHLKVPAGDARTELRLPLSAGAQVPERLVELVTGIAAGEELGPVAIVKTLRHRSRVYDGDRLLVEIADDEVHGTELGAAVRVTSWRELEVELGDGDERLLQKVSARLRNAGATESKTGSKLARTLDWTDPISSAGKDPRGLFIRYLSEQLVALGGGDVALRRGLDPVHKTRVAARRFRSVLRIFDAALLDPDGAHWLDDELSWYQDLLGEVRDRQVQRARFSESVHSLPSELVLGPVAADIEQSLLREQVSTAANLNAALASERYLALMRAIMNWAAEPRVRPDVDADGILRVAENARRKARKRLRQALAADDAMLLHRARKATKRARYATELTAPLVGKPAKKTIKAHKVVQDALGEHQDSVIAAELLYRLGAAATGAGQNGFTYGLLYQRERQRAELTRRDARRLRL